MKTSILFGDQPFKRVKGEYLFFLFLFVGLWLYIWLRAIFTQMTHDETATFFRYVQLGRFLPFYSEMSANNHILNSILSYWFFKIFGPEPFALRLANILSFPIYFYYVIHVGSLIQKKFLRLSFVLSLVFIHNFLEFFAMSRGYGISMAFLMPAIWYLFKALQQIQVRDYVKVLVFSVLAFSANLTLLNSLIIIVFLLFARILFTGNHSIRHRWKYHAIIIFLGIVPIVFFAVYLFAMKDNNQLYYGETSGFWQVTVKSLLNTMLGSQSIALQIIIWVYFLVMVAAAFLFLIRTHNLEKAFNRSIIFFSLLFVNIIAAILLNILLGINYPEDRTGLYFVVYFVGSICFITDLLSGYFKFKPAFLLAVPLYLIPLHFFLHMNLSHNSFESQKIPSRFYDKIAAGHVFGTPPPTIGGHRMREFRWAFLNYSCGGVLGKVHASLYPDTIEDFQIVDRNYPEEGWQLYDSLDYEPTSGMYLLKRRREVPGTLVFSADQINNKDVGDRYYNMLVLPVDSLAGETLQINFDLHFNTTAKPFKAWVVTSVRNAQNEQVGYEYMALDWLKYDWENDNGRIINTMIVKISPDADKLIFYVWNILEDHYDLLNGRLELYRYETIK